MSTENILPLSILSGEGLGQPRLEIELLGIPQHEQRHHIFLWADTALFIGVPVNMNCQTGHDSDRGSLIKERGTDLARRAQQRRATRYGEIAVKRGVEERAPINVDP